MLTACILLDSPPTASFTASTSGGPAPLTVTFDAGASNDPDGDIVGFRWLFGDGGEGSGETTSHTYSAAGQYEVELAVEDDAGWHDYANLTVCVGNSVPYDDLFRDNESYIGDIVYYRGEIIQVRESFGSYDWRVATGENQYLGYVGDVIWGNYAGPRYLEGDVIELCGVVKGLKTYTAVLGQQVTVPEVDVVWVTLSE